jgi:YidC/Oxa1 family membrane protein insertase
LDKRLLIVLPLCLAIILGWKLFAERMGWTRARMSPPPPAAASAPLAANPTAPGSDAPTNGARAADGAPKTEPAAPTTALVSPRVADAEERELVLTVGHFRAVFTNRGAALKELRTSEYVDSAGLDAGEKSRFEHWEKLVAPLESNGATLESMILRTSPSSDALRTAPLETELWNMRPLGPSEAATGVEFELAPGTGVTFFKRLWLVPDERRVRVELAIRNDALAQGAGAREFVLTPAACVPAESGDRYYPEPRVIAASRPRPDQAPLKDVVTREERGPDAQGAFTLPSPLSFVGVYNKYFAVLLHAVDDSSRPALIGASWRRLRDDAWARENPAEADRARRQIVGDVQLELALPQMGEKRTWDFDVYAGPKDRATLEQSWPDHAVIPQNDLGFFNAISSVLLVVLNGLHWLTRNWGVAIILLTVLVRALLFPINRRSQTAMARYATKQKRLQPRIDEIKKKYASDAARQRQEQAKLMQQEGLFPPLGGCLPMFVQIPVFFGLYRALGVSFDLRQASFLGWINDLSLPDRMFEINLSTHLPFLGTIQYLNVLPPIMVALWIWQQRGMPLPADEQAAKMQKMMMWMPVMMGFFLYNYAAGLSLYMITQSSLGVIEQKVIKKYWPVDDREQPTKKTGFMKRLMEAQEQQMKKMQNSPRRPARKTPR